MQRRIIISADDYEVRTAVIENGKLAEYFFERHDEQRIVGNIYKGLVTSIIQGIDAAFIDIGLPRNAFLYVNDLYPQIDDFGLYSEDENGVDDGPAEAKLPEVNIRDLIKEQQTILVQLYKEPIGAKGSRVTTNISLPGRYLVLLPNTHHIGISRRIEDEFERERLKTIVTNLIPENMGAIIRTAGKDMSEEDFRVDLDFLLEEWKQINQKSESLSAPSLVFENPGTIFLLIRDLISDGIEEIVVNDPKLYDSLIDFVKEQTGERISPVPVHLYDDSTPVFYAYGIENEINSLRSKKVWLNRGGYIVIEETEAMTVIDVNTGRYLGKHNLEETVFQTNMESAGEIARQIRLRDIGGIILVDFIDMKEPEHQEQLIEHFENCLKHDRTRTYLYPLTELGLLQMTRKRVRKSLNKHLTQPCPYCRRDGHILSAETMIIKIFRTFEEICNEESVNRVTLRVHPRLATKIHEEKQHQINVLQERYQVEFNVLPGSDLHYEQIVEEIA